MSRLAVGRSDPSELAGARALLAETESHDGVAPVGESGLLALAAGEAEEFLLARETPGRGSDAHVAEPVPSPIVGVAWTDGVSAELAVAPAHRRRGVGTELARALADAHPAARIWQHGRVPGAAEFARAAGLEPVRELLHMRWEARHTAVPPVPDGWTVRPFTPGDGAAWVALNAEVFADHPEQGRISEGDLAARTAEPWFDPELFWLVEGPEGDLAGYAWLKPGEREDELYVIGLAPAARGSGLAAHLVARAQQAAAARGRQGLSLYVDAVNRSAVRSYERAGFVTDGADLQYAPKKEEAPDD